MKPQHIALIACVTLLAIFGLVVGGLVLLITYHPKLHHTTTVISTIGDSNGGSFLIPSPSQVYSITISLKGTIADSVKVTVNGSSNQLIKSSQNLKATIPGLIGPSRYNYNYYEADVPIYLVTGSVLVYTL